MKPFRISVLALLALGLSLSANVVRKTSVSCVPVVSPPGCVCFICDGKLVCNRTGCGTP